MSQDDSPALSPTQIEALCRKAAAGDESALQRLLLAHGGRLEGFIRRKIGPDWRGKIDPDDILQETYIDIAKSIAGFEYQGEESFYRWTTRIIDHRFVDQVRHLRRKKRDAAREVTGAGKSESRHESFLAKHFADSMTASRVMRKADAVNALMACIARLPEDYRVVVQRYYLNEEPLTGIAADLDRSEDAIRRLAGRAVERLSACLRSSSRFFTSRD